MTAGFSNRNRSAGFTLTHSSLLGFWLQLSIRIRCGSFILCNTAPRRVFEPTSVKYFLFYSAVPSLDVQLALTCILLRCQMRPRVFAYVNASCICASTSICHVCNIVLNRPPPVVATCAKCKTQIRRQPILLWSGYSLKKSNVTSQRKNAALQDWQVMPDSAGSRN